jgi:tetratricopeptide (TPR) repeat protein
MDVFRELVQALNGAGAAAAVDLLIERLEQDRRHAEWFQARLMRKRLELGLPPADSPDQLPEAARAAYDAAQIETAREAGKRYLEDGDILRAWPYFRAIGDHQPVIEAIENLEPGQFSEGILSLSFQERLNPKKALELLLQNNGICRAITVFDQYPDPATWEQGLSLITRSLYEELEQSLKLAITRRDGSAPENSGGIRGLIAGREWLFGEYDSYVDASHLFGILRLALDSSDSETLRRALELAEYGCCLSATFRNTTPPPFDDYCRDHAIYLRALMGEDVDAGIAHFFKKIEEADPERAGTFPAEVLIRLLLRLGRPDEAVRVFEQFLLNRDPSFLTCPDLSELCQRAGDFERLQELSRERNDPVGFLQAALAAKRPC